MFSTLWRYSFCEYGNYHRIFDYIPNVYYDISCQHKQCICSIVTLPRFQYDVPIFHSIATCHRWRRNLQFSLKFAESFRAIFDTDVLISERSGVGNFDAFSLYCVFQRAYRNGTSDIGILYFIFFVSLKSLITSTNIDTLQLVSFWKI